MRYASRGDAAQSPSPLHISIDALVEEARRVERERTLLEVRREIGAVPLTKSGGQYRYSSEDRSVRDVARDMMAVIDRKLS